MAARIRDSVVNPGYGLFAPTNDLAVARPEFRLVPYFALTLPFAQLYRVVREFLGVALTGEQRPLKRAQVGEDLTLERQVCVEACMIGPGI
jgi:hypothetical protein